MKEIKYYTKSGKPTTKENATYCQLFETDTHEQGYTEIFLIGTYIVCQTNNYKLHGDEEIKVEMIIEQNEF